MIDDTGKIEKFLPLIFRLDKDIVYDVKIDKHREKRSLNANAYLWKLVTEIGNILNKSKEEVYLQMLIDYGQSEMVSILSEIDVKGYFKYYKLAGTSILNGKEFNHYKIYKGSSEYDTKEMSILLNGVVQEAKNLGIKTKDDIELERLVEEWC
jgi:hypothetical protein|nr:MAG TPA: NinB protein [Caudoviricetes sp.]